MFEDIAKMEEEIKVFRQNVLASSQLVEGISSLVDETQKQQALMKQVSADYQNDIKSIANQTIDKIEKLELDTINKISTESTELQSEIAKRDIEAIGEIKATINERLSEAINQISEANKAYVDELETVDASVKAVQFELTEKYNQFSNRMDSVKVDEVQKTCSDLKKRMELKSTLVIIGIIVIISLEIARFFI